MTGRAGRQPLLQILHADQEPPDLPGLDLIPFLKVANTAGKRLDDTVDELGRRYPQALDFIAAHLFVLGRRAQALTGYLPAILRRLVRCDIGIGRWRIIWRWPDIWAKGRAYEHAPNNFRVFVWVHGKSGSQSMTGCLICLWA